MTLNAMIPQVWAGALLSKLRTEYVLAQPGVVNDDYEGDVSAYGDRVKIHGIGAVTVFDVTKNADIPAPEVLQDDETILIIDQQKGFNFAVDDIDKAQQNPKVMNAAMAESGVALKGVLDTYLSGFYTSAPAANKLGTDAAPITPTADTAYDMIVDLSVLLDENNVPAAGRWVAVPPFFRGLLRKDKRFTEAFPDEVIKNGRIGQVGGMTVLVSNNVHKITNGGGGTTPVWHMMASYPGAITLAEQIVRVEGYRPERRFSDAVKGLHVYGAKVIRPTALALACVAR